MPVSPKPAKETPLPATLPACADLLYTTREKRLKMQKEAEAMEKLESRLKEHLINKCQKGASKGISGKIGRVTIERKDVPTLKDWGKFIKHIIKTGDTELLQHQISKKAVQERLDAKKVIPGIELFGAVTVSCVKA